MGGVGIGREREREKKFKSIKLKRPSPDTAPQLVLEVQAKFNLFSLMNSTQSVVFKRR